MFSPPGNFLQIFIFWNSCVRRTKFTIKLEVWRENTDTQTTRGFENPAVLRFHHKIKQAARRNHAKITGNKIFPKLNMARSSLLHFEAVITKYHTWRHLLYKCWTDKGHVRTVHCTMVLTIDKYAYMCALYDTDTHSHQTAPQHGQNY